MSESRAILCEPPVPVVSTCKLNVCAGGDVHDNDDDSGDGWHKPNGVTVVIG